MLDFTPRTNDRARVERHRTAPRSRPVGPPVGSGFLIEIVNRPPSRSPRPPPRTPRPHCKKIRLITRVVLGLGEFGLLVADESAA
jgi:hypothetical protein